MTAFCAGEREIGINERGKGIKKAAFACFEVVKGIGKPVKRRVLLFTGIKKPPSGGS